MNDLDLTKKARVPRFLPFAHIAAYALVGGLASAPKVSGQMSAASTVDVQKIVQGAVERARAQEGAVAQFESMMLSIVESLDGEGAVKKEEKAVYRRYPILGAVYDEMIEKDGRPLTEKELAKEKKQKEEFIREVQKRTARGDSPQPQDEQRVSFDEELIGRYRLKLTDDETIRGYDCWVIYLEPREGKLPVRRRIDRALNNSTGKLWITKGDYGLARVEFQMQRPFKYWGGLVAVIRNTVGGLNFEPIEPHLWMPADFVIELDLRIFFKNIRRRITMNWSDYKRVDASIPTSSTTRP